MDVKARILQISPLLMINKKDALEYIVSNYPKTVTEFFKYRDSVGDDSDKKQLLNLLDETVLIDFLKRLEISDQKIVLGFIDANKRAEIEDKLDSSVSEASAQLESEPAAEAKRAIPEIIITPPPAEEIEPSPIIQESTRATKEEAPVTIAAEANEAGVMASEEPHTAVEEPREFEAKPLTEKEVGKLKSELREDLIKSLKNPNHQKSAFNSKLIDALRIDLDALRKETNRRNKGFFGIARILPNSRNIVDETFIRIQPKILETAITEIYKNQKICDHYLASITNPEAKTLFESIIEGGYTRSIYTSNDEELETLLGTADNKRTKEQADRDLSNAKSKRNLLSTSITNDGKTTIDLLIEYSSKTTDNNEKRRIDQLVESILAKNPTLIITESFIAHNKDLIDKEIEKAIDPKKPNFVMLRAIAQAHPNPAELDYKSELFKNCKTKEQFLEELDKQQKAHNLKSTDKVTDTSVSHYFLKSMFTSDSYFDRLIDDRNNITLSSSNKTLIALSKNKNALNDYKNDWEKGISKLIELGKYDVVRDILKNAPSLVIDLKLVTKHPIAMATIIQDHEILLPLLRELPEDKLKEFLESQIVQKALNAKNPSGKSALDIFVAENNVALLKKLLNAHPSPESMQFDRGLLGQTRTETQRLVLKVAGKKTADVKAQLTIDEQVVALEKKIRAGKAISTEEAPLLMAKSDKTNDTILHRLVNDNVAYDVIEPLLTNKMGKNVLLNAQNKDGVTPLQLVAEKGNVVLLEKFLEVLPEVDIKTQNELKKRAAAQLKDNISKTLQNDKLLTPEFQGVLKAVGLSFDNLKKHHEKTVASSAFGTNKITKWRSANTTAEKAVKQALERHSQATAQEQAR
jgi:hypothetical protein